MKLVIAEKPSVAQSLAAVLGAKERGQGYLQGNGYVVSWCVGHLIGLAAADSYDPKYSKWCYEDLPIIPKQWKYAVAPDKKEQYEVPDEPPGCGEPCVCHRRRTGRRTDFPSGL